jgi:hypothetical protein
MALAFAGFSGDGARLVIGQKVDPTGSYPESKLYTGVLVNGGSTDLALTAVQMPGGYVGAGTFFNCSVEEWNVLRKSWVAVTTTDLKGFTNPQLDRILLRRNEERAVCQELLPHDGGRAGGCVRFRLQGSWESGSPHWLSSPFLIGSMPGEKSCP